MTGPVLRLLGNDAEVQAGPAAAGRVLGSNLRRLRTQQGLTLGQVAPHVGASVSTLSRMERGMHPPKSAIVMQLMGFYGVRAPEDLAAVRQLLLQTEKKEWWHHFSDALPGWMQRLVGTESMATEIRTYHRQYVPGLVQTPDYARAVVSMAFTSPEEAASQIDRRVKVRLERQRILHQADPPLYSALLDESILYRPLGDIPVFRAQLRTLHMLEENSDRINIRIVPYSAGQAGMAPAPALTYMRFGSGDTQELIYFEQHPTGGRYLSGPQEIEDYRHALDKLTNAAADREESMRMLQNAAERLGR